MDILQFRKPPKQDRNFISTIVETVADHLNLNMQELTSKSRKRELVFGRQLAMSLSKKLTNCTFRIIGLEIANKDHATVMYACKTIQNLMDTDKDIQGIYNSLYFKVINKISPEWKHIRICPFCESEDIYNHVLQNINNHKIIKNNSETDFVCFNCNATNFKPLTRDNAKNKMETISTRGEISY